MGHYLNETTFSDEITAFLLSCRSNSIRKKILWKLVQKRRKISNHTYSQSIYRIKKRGIIKDKNDTFILSNYGKKLYTYPYRKIREKPLKENKVMIIFDISEKNRKVRNWLRGQIKDWDFKMIQKSVWVGYGPLPKEFRKRLKILKVSDGVKIYNLQKRG